MAVLATRIQVTPTAKRLDVPETVTRWALTIVNRGTESIFLGGAGVTVAEGLELGVGERMSITLRPGDAGLFAVANTGSHRVDRLQVGWS